MTTGLKLQKRTHVKRKTAPRGRRKTLFLENPVCELVCSPNGKSGQPEVGKVRENGKIRRIAIRSPGTGRRKMRRNDERDEGKHQPEYSGEDRLHGSPPLLSVKLRKKIDDKCHHAMRYLHPEGNRHDFDQE